MGTDPVPQTSVPTLPAAAFRGTVTLLVLDKAVGREGVMPSQALRAAADGSASTALMDGELLQAYGFTTSGPDAAGDVTAISSTPFGTPDRNGVNPRHHRGSHQSASGRSSTVDRMTHGARAPQGGMQSPPGGGGAMSPLASAMGSALVAAPCLRFTSRPAVRLASTHGRRLERPG